jgi:hypothetical protein
MARIANGLCGMIGMNVQNHAVEDSSLESEISHTKRCKAESGAKVALRTSGPAALHLAQLMGKIANLRIGRNGRSAPPIAMDITHVPEPLQLLRVTAVLLAVAVLKR